jgi:hypothetical protein
MTTSIDPIEWKENEPGKHCITIEDWEREVVDPDLSTKSAHSDRKAVNPSVGSG